MVVRKKKKSTSRTGNLKKGKKEKPKRSRDLPLSLVVYGPPGIGKTSFAAAFPKPLFIIDPQEDGIYDLVQRGQCEAPVDIVMASDWEKTLALVNEASSTDGIETIVLDSATGFEKLCFLYHCREYFDDDWTSKGFYSYQQGPKNAAKKDWPILLDELNLCRMSDHPKTVILLAHSQIKTFSNPEGADYDRYSPYMDKETWAQTHRWAGMVLFYNYYIDLDKKASATKSKAKPKGEHLRYLYTEWAPTYDAKNRHGLQSVIEAGESGKDSYKSFQEALGK